MVINLFNAHKNHAAIEDLIFLHVICIVTTYLDHTTLTLMESFSLLIPPLWGSII